MSSGSYFPPPVRAVEIAKAGGKGVRVLGVPTVADRVAQTVARRYLEPQVEPVFHPDSYGYRPGKSALDAVAACRQRCWRADWVIDLDIRAFFDTVRWDLALKAIARHIAPGQRWILLYAERWLKAPLQQPDGTLVTRDRGTPQGSAISPLIANLFMHYAFDAWMAREFPGVRFERYCDDAVVHCASEQQACQVRDAIAGRLAEVGLELHPDKTRVVYCKDDDRRDDHEVTSFVFLGYEFRPRLAKNKYGRHFVAFLPAVSKEAMKAMGAEIRSWNWAKRSDKSLGDLALMFNSIVQGSPGGSTTTGASTAPGWSASCGGSTTTWSGGPAANTTSGCATASAARWNYWPGPPGAIPACSRTGGSARVLTAGQWEPDESRGSCPVLREPGGAIPPGHSPSARVHRIQGRSRGDQTAAGAVPARRTQAGTVRQQDADHPRPHRRGPLPRL
jgi:group II intron reverse transcriptase/maturase